MESVWSFGKLSEVEKILTRRWKIETLDPHGTPVV